MIHKTLRLALTDAEVNRLKTAFRKVTDHLEQDAPLKPKILEELQRSLSEVVESSSGWQEVLAGLRTSGEFYCLHLLHDDNEILNLPWSMAIDKTSGKPLGLLEHLVIAKGVPGYYRENLPGIPVLPPPLKVLIMISSPLDAQWKERLSFEKEEEEILKAFDPLIRSGLVEIDFTGDGSLETLKQKLKSTRYHILHFSGHAAYDEETNLGVLVLEDPVSLKKVLVSAEDFAEGVNCNPGYLVPMVVLSSCQTAQGHAEKGLPGITNQLLRVGVPVVISMGMSIFDRYAALFTAHLYKQIAGKQWLALAFNEAVRFLREKEYQDLAQVHVTGPGVIPLQWIIPNLYLSRDIEGVVDWDRPIEKMVYTSGRYIFEKDRLLLPHEEDYLFIGRRREKAEILQPFFDKQPVLLKGLGGVGKTALAEHLVQRLIARSPNTQPLVFNEKTKSIDDILKALQNFFLSKLKVHVTVEVKKYEKAMEKFIYLLSEMAKEYNPVVVFDNLEAFQSGIGGPFLPEYSDIKEVIDFLCDSACGQFHVILTCRYPVPDVKNLRVFDLNQVGLNDTWKKCLYLDVGHINTYLKELAKEQAMAGGVPKKVPEFIDVVKLLHSVFGGNYRYLEFFNEVLRERPGKIKESLASLERFAEETRAEAEQVRERMGKNLLFTQLMALVEPGERVVLEVLSHFRIPVQEWALELQLNKSFYGGAGGGFFKKSPLLESLRRLTLIEVSQDRESRVYYYYATPIVKDLLGSYEAGKDTGADGFSFSHEMAGIYYDNSFHNMGGGLTALEEAFYHFDKAGNTERVAEIGERLSGFYEECYMYRKVFFYAGRVYEVKEDETGIGILNRLGRIYQLYGDYEGALDFFKKALVVTQKEGDKEAEGTILNNIGQIYDARGDYDTALNYLEQSLKISQEIGDKMMEVPTLNNIGILYYARGDYETALNYLEPILEITQELGDKMGEGTALNNISQIYKDWGDYETALNYLERSLKIDQELGDIQGEGITLNSISQVYVSCGDDETALSYLEQSLKIRQEIGDKAGEGTTLNNLATTAYARGDYDTALNYLEQSLKIRQEIGDKTGEGTTLNNISQIYDARGDYDTALKYLEKSLIIFQQIGDKKSEGTTMNNISQVYDAHGDYDTALKYLGQSLKIQQEIGDKRGEGTTLNNISGIYRDRGDYDTALNYLEQSLKIHQEIGDKRGMANALHNIAITVLDKNEKEKYLEYDSQAYGLALETGDAFQIYRVGWNLGSFLYQNGGQKEKARAAAMLQKSLDIGKTAGFPDVGELEEDLKRMMSDE